MTGYDVTFRRTDNGIGVVADVRNKVFVKPSLYELFEDAVRGIHDEEQSRQKLHVFFQNHLRNKIGILSYTKRWIMMDSICWENERTEFQKKDGSWISYGPYP